MLEKFGKGWRETFTKRLEHLQSVLPDLKYSSIERFNGMLRIKATTNSEDNDYIVKCVLYCIERESAKTCENCGKYGFRKNTDILPVQKCLCLMCYTIEVDNTLSQQSQ